MVWIIATSSRTGCVTPITKQNERKKIVSTSTAPHCRRGAPRQLHAVASALLASPCFPVTTPRVLRSPEPTPRPAPLLVLCAACTLATASHHGPTPASRPRCATPASPPRCVVPPPSTLRGSRAAWPRAATPMEGLSAAEEEETWGRKGRRGREKNQNWEEDREKGDERE
ncbi:hypothetical protein PVAP13_6NG228403 [Panicum virgatum]|uniref:Uncharacterized protein n=1 Tax=Panicum virgatum TaxID=38727 RepID=A0A8T0QZ62_PANVG|nr:hypothetical protein PVAP13_6NG228403 [Panicum virgatum]